jgi:hypothetical protein
VAKERSSSLGADLVIPALAAGFAVYFLVSTSGLVWEAKANGVVIGVVLLALLAFQVGRIFWTRARGEGELGFDSLWRPRGLALKRLAMIGITAAFVALLPWLGLTLGLWLGMLAQLLVTGVRRRAILVWLPLATAAACYLLFIVVINAEFPHGPVERLLGLLF